MLWRSNVEGEKRKSCHSIVLYLNMHMIRRFRSAVAEEKLK